MAAASGMARGTWHVDLGQGDNEYFLFFRRHDMAHVEDDVLQRELAVVLLLAIVNVPHQPSSPLAPPSLRPASLR
jgi:hypothetical protein